MIVIFSIDGDHSTDEVMDWLHFYKSNYKRINISRVFDKACDISIDVYNDISKIDEIHSRDIKIAWLRKYGNYRESDRFKKLYYQEGYFVTKYFADEEKIIKNFFFEHVSNWLCHPDKIYLNKIAVLHKAKHHHLNIPKTIICNSREMVYKIMRDWKCAIVIKSASELPVFDKEEMKYFPLTRILSLNDANSLPDYFFPSLIQSYIQKEYEIRSFYIDGIFYSVAIFSQSDEGTSVDFRNYNYTKPNRMVPYQLPVTVENNLNNLFHALGLNTGSVDLLRGIDREYYFLEINPCGQFGMISGPANYNIEKVIAEYLLK